MYLERGFLLQQLSPYGSNVMKEPKVLMRPPFRSLFPSSDNSIGGIREDFVADMVSFISNEFYYLKDMRGRKCPDFLLMNEDKKIVFEVGGRSKSHSQFKELDLKYDTLIFKPGAGVSGIERSLSLLGFLY